MQIIICGSKKEKNLCINMETSREKNNTLEVSILTILYFNQNFEAMIINLKTFDRFFDTSYTITKVLIILELKIILLNVTNILNMY